MDTYTRMLLQLLFSLQAGLSGVEVFVFSTRLTRITKTMGHRDAGAALDAVSSHVEDWSGGTRIG